MNDQVKQTLLARVYDVAVETPLEWVPKLSKNSHTQVYLKREDLQPVHSFKLRGAYNKMASLTAAEKAKGVIAVSAGNHAQGVALSAQRLGISAVIVMPTTTPSIKIDAVRSYGAEVVLKGDSFPDAYDYSLTLTKKSNRTFIHPFDDPLVIAGQGTIGREILEQLPDVTHIFVPVGGGGLIAGIAQYVKELNPRVKIIGVEPEDTQTLKAALKAGKPVDLSHVGMFADGVAVKRIGKHTFTICKQYVDEVVTVTTDQICAGIKAVFEDTRSIVEPAGALAAAAVMNYKLSNKAQVVAICSGANVTFERLQQIAERTLIGSGKEALFAVTMPERPGTLKAFCKEVMTDHSISEFSYRLDIRGKAHILVGVSVAGPKDRADLARKMKAHGYDNIDLSENDVAKEHVRHMIGGPASGANHEHFYEIEFPERPGALGDFLAAVGTDWNISAFHYRSAASDSANVLIGFEIEHPRQLEQKMTAAGYEWNRVNNNAALKSFIE